MSDDLAAVWGVKGPGLLVTLWRVDRGWLWRLRLREGYCRGEVWEKVASW